MSAMGIVQRARRTGNFFMLAPLFFVLSGCGQIIDRLSSAFDAQSKNAGEINVPSNSMVAPSADRLDASVVSPRPSSSSALGTYATQEEVIQKGPGPSLIENPQNQQAHKGNNDAIGFHQDPADKSVRIGKFVFDMSNELPEVRRVDRPTE